MKNIIKSNKRRIILVLALFVLSFSQLNAQENNSIENSKSDSYNYTHFRLALTGGWSYRLGRVSDGLPPELNDFINDLRSGRNYGIDLSYFFNKYIGVGFKYHDFQSSAKTKNSMMIQGVYTRFNVSDKINMKYVGPFFTARFFNENNNVSLVLGAGFGYMNYLEDFTYLDDFRLEGWSLGASYDVGFDVKIFRNFSLGAKLSCIIGSLTNYKMTDLTTNERMTLDNNENMSHFNAALECIINL